jgi:DNA helicase HerA-like ATPase
MYTKDEKLYVAHSDKPIYMTGKMANRHGLIAGATGTGKTVSLQVLAETFSQAGVPCFMADMKGDLSGISQPGSMNKFIEKRCTEFGLEAPAFAGCPTRFFDVFGEKGHPMRTTISEMGPQLLARLMDLNDTQSGILNIVFKIADDKGLLLIDVKDLRLMLDFVGKNASDFTTNYGNITSQSIGAIQRSLLGLESQGADIFFGEPSFNINDLMQCEGGKGIMNVLAADRLMQNPKLYSTFLLWLLSEIYTQLPEVGDLPLPRFIFFFDEAHTLFDDTPKALVDKIEQVVRLIRSKGVGIYFITQNPIDIPDSILGQLGNRIQHALRAFTPNDQKAVKAAARTFRPNPAFETEDAIMQLGTGEALVSFLEENGAPAMVEKAKILFPLSSIGAITDAQRSDIIHKSRLFGIYERSIDRQSAYEVLSAQNQVEAQRQKQEEDQKAYEKEQAQRAKEEAQRQKEAAQQQKEMERQYRTSAPSRTSSRTSPLEKAIGSAASSIGRNLGNQIIRSILGSIFKK